MQREESNIPIKKTSVGVSALTNTDLYSCLTHNPNNIHVIILKFNKMQTFLRLKDRDGLTDPNLKLIR